MARSGQQRASGELASTEEAEKQAEFGAEPLGVAPESDDLTKPPAPPSLQDVFRNPGWQRMRLDWRSEDGDRLRSVLRTVDDRVIENFADAFVLMHELFEVVRKPEVDADGAAMLDRHGFPIWKRTPAGGWEEDWTALGSREREQFLFQITTRLFDWELRAADAWGEAMFARAMWEERFSIDFDAPISGTIEDRTAVGKMGAADERYFALFVSLYSRKSESIVRSLNLLGQRLKDSMS